MRTQCALKCQVALKCHTALNGTHTHAPTTPAQQPQKDNRRTTTERQHQRQPAQQPAANAACEARAPFPHRMRPQGVHLSAACAHAPWVPLQQARFHTWPRTEAHQTNKQTDRSKRMQHLLKTRFFTAQPASNTPTATSTTNAA